MYSLLAGRRLYAETASV